MDIRFVYILAFFVLGFVQCKLLNLKCEGIKKFVDGHNARRLQLAKGKVPGQPAASEMNSIMWDSELAAKAGKWASKNKYGHNPDKTIPSNRFDTGENIYWYGTSGQSLEFDADKALDAWFNEYRHYRYKALDWKDFTDGPAVGHYTQMAWSDTTYVGCAISQYQEDGWNKFFVVCNYGPAGNYVSQTPYKRGTPSGFLACGTDDCSRMYGDSC